MAHVIALRARALARTPAQVASVAESIGEPWPAAVLATGAALGLRQGEILGLAVDDIDFLRRTVHVRRQVQWPHGAAMFKLPKGEGTGRAAIRPGRCRAVRAHRRSPASHSAAALRQAGRQAGERSAAVLRRCQARAASVGE